MRVLFILFSLLLFTGLTNAFAEEQCMGNACMPEEAQNACIENKSYGCIDWTEGVIYATGTGVPSSEVKSSAQKRFSAIRAAKVVAMRNLLQMVEETNIDSSTTVKMGMLENDTINTQIQGTVKQVEQVGERILSDGSVIVTMKMYLKDIMSVLYNQEQMKFNQNQRNAEQNSAPVAEKKAPADPNQITYGGQPDVIYTGLIIDARGTGVKPAMSPKIYDDKGVEVYGSANVEREFALQQGIAGYVKDANKAQTNDRVAGNPLIIKATASQGAKSADLKISDKDAELLRQVETKQTFLREARVLILI